MALQKTSPRPPLRPKFNSNLTSDRLRVGSGTITPRFLIGKATQKDRKSMFKELGLDDVDSDSTCSTPSGVTLASCLGASSYGDASTVGQIPSAAAALVSRASTSGLDLNSTLHGMADENPPIPGNQGLGASATSLDEQEHDQTSETNKWYSRLRLSSPRPRIPTAASPPPHPVSTLQRVTMLALLIAVAIPSLAFRGGEGSAVANAGVVPREQSPVDVCKRWAQQGE
jgi:hypothetical protein